MSQGAQLYRFRLDVSDVDRSFYEPLDFRVAQHKSESVPYMLTRVIAFALNAGDGVQFSPQGLAEPDDPCISAPSARGGLELWIEVGNPSARRLHKAAKAARTVKVYTYKNPQALLDEMAAEKIHQAERIEIYSLSEEFLGELEARLERDNEWGLIRDQDSLIVSVGDESIQGTLMAHAAPESR